MVNETDVHSRVFSCEQEMTTVERAKHIISNYFPVDIYKIEYYSLSEKIVILVRNIHLDRRYFAPCIHCEIYNTDPLTLDIYMLRECGEEPPLRGKSLLERLIAFSEAYGFSQITLQDESHIRYEAKEADRARSKPYYVSLQQLLRLKTGQSWYEQFGFTNDVVEQYKFAISKYIQQPIGFVHPEQLSRLQTYNSSITVDTPIYVAVSYLYDILKGLCPPKRECSNKIELNTVDDINNIVEIMYNRMLRQINVNADDLKKLSLKLPRKQHGSSQKTRRNKKINRKSYIQQKRLRKTRRHYRKRGGENWWEKIEIRKREPISSEIPLPKPIRLIGEPYVPPQLRNARASYRSNLINQNLARSTAMHPINQNDAANAAMLAAKASEIVSARAAKAAKVEAAKVEAANLGRATMKGLLSNKSKKVINSRKYYGPGSRIQENRNIAKGASNL